MKGPLSPEKKVSLLILVSMVLVPETETAVSPELATEHVSGCTVGRGYLNIAACGYLMAVPLFLALFICLSSSP